MGIGTSKGAFYTDEAHYQSSKWDNRYDNNEILGDPTADYNILTPQDLKLNQDLEKSEMDNLGLEASLKDKNKMPFPDNRNPDSEFNSRFGNLPPSGILNDLRPSKEAPLRRRMDLSGGN